MRTALESNDVDLMLQIARALADQGRDDEAREWHAWAHRRRANADLPARVVTPRDKLRFARHLVGEHPDPVLEVAADRMAEAIERGRVVVPAFHALSQAISEHIRTIAGPRSMRFLVRRNPKYPPDRGYPRGPGPHLN